MIESNILTRGDLVRVTGLCTNEPILDVTIERRKDDCFLRLSHRQQKSLAGKTLRPRTPAESNCVVELL